MGEQCLRQTFVMLSFCVISLVGPLFVTAYSRNCLTRYLDYFQTALGAHTQEEALQDYSELSFLHFLQRNNL